MAKAAEAFRTISEVADELDLHKHVLRFWEVKFPQIKPMKRGGGRRYYRPQDLELLRGIRHLLHAEGYTIKGVQRILRERGIDTVKKIGGEVAETGTAASVRSLPAPERDDAEEAADAASRMPVRTATTRKSVEQPAAAKAKSGGNKLDTRKGLQAVIIELEACRAILMGRGDEVAPVETQARGARAAG